MILVHQAVTLSFGTPTPANYFTAGGLTAGMRVNRWCPVGWPTAKPSVTHNGQSFYTPVQFVRETA